MLSLELFFVNLITVLHVLFLILFSVGVIVFLRQYHRGLNGFTVALIFVSLGLVAGEAWSVMVLVLDEPRIIRLLTRSLQMILLLLSYIYLLWVSHNVSGTLSDRLKSKLSVFTAAQDLILKSSYGDDEVTKALQECIISLEEIRKDLKL